MAGRALRPALPAHRPAEGRRRPGRRGDVDHLRRAPPRAAGAGRCARGDGRHLRALRHRLGAGDRGAHRKAVRLVLASPLELQTLHDRVLHAGALGARGDQERRDGGHVRASSSSSSWAAATGRWTPTTRASCRSSTGCGSTPSTSARATSTSSRGAIWRDPLSHRRRDAHRLPAAARRDERDDGAHQAARPHGRGREAPPAGRPHQDRATRSGDEVEMRLSTLPTAFGEKMVMRIFDPDTAQ